jgi:hypothetical protein
LKNTCTPWLPPGDEIEIRDGATTPFATNTEVCGSRRVTPADETFKSLRPAWGTKTYLAYERVDPGTNVGSIAVISREAGSTPCVVAASGANNRNPSWTP